MKKTTTRSIGLISLALGLLTSRTHAMDSSAYYDQQPTTRTVQAYYRDQNLQPLVPQNSGITTVSVDAYGKSIVSWTPTASADQFGLSYSAPQSNDSQTQQFIALGQATYTVLNIFVKLWTDIQNTGNEFGIGGGTTSQPATRPAVSTPTTSIGYGTPTVPGGYRSPSTPTTFPASTPQPTRTAPAVTPARPAATGGGYVSITNPGLVIPANAAILPPGYGPYILRQ